MYFPFLRRAHNILLAGGAAFLFSVAATQASANCAGKDRVVLSDGSKACVLRKEPTQINRTRSIAGGSQATTLKSSVNGAAIVLNFYEENGAGVGRNTIHKRATETCERFRDEMLKMVKRPGNPFMVVVLTWGKARVASDGRTSFEAVSNTFFTRNCWVKRGTKP